MTRYINPYTDFGFKKLFGEEANKDILIDFLNSLLPTKHHIKELEFINTEQLPESIEERKAFFDIRCTSVKGERFIIEMQKGKVDNFKDRTLYYLTYPIRQQAEKGKWNYWLDPVYFIGVLDFEFPNSADFMEFIELKNKRNEVFYDKLGLIYLQMPKFNKTENELDTHTDKWFYFLKNLESFDSIPTILNEPVFRRAFEIAEFTKLPKEQQYQYEKSRVDYVSWDLVKESSFKDGEKKGKKDNSLEIAKNLKNLSIPINSIIKATGLTEQEINDL